jgi:hypothetical protein
VNCKNIVIRSLAAAALLQLQPTVSAQRPGAGGRIVRRADTIKPGDRAPDFQLKTLDGQIDVQLSKLYQDRPVALIFGSYT